MENESPSTQTSDPSNGQLIFATLRDLFAELYSAENDARVVVDDAGLDAKQIAFSARAQTNWHHILIEAVRQDRLDIVLSIARTAYPGNPRLKDAYTQYTLFTKQGGEITPPDHLAIDNPGPTVETEGGAYVARNVSTEQGDFVGRDKTVYGDEVSGNKIEGDQIDARESRGFINRSSGPVTQHYGNTFHIGTFKIPKPLAWAVLALFVISVGFIGYIALSTGSIRTAVTAPTATAIPTVPTATPTTTPLPTATPLAFATEAPDETLIVIATFLVTEGNRDTLAHREIRNKIQEEAQKAGESNLRVQLEPTILASDHRAQAEALGQQYHASMIIWGDDTGVRMTVNFLNLRQPDSDAATVTINETQRTQLASPNEYSQFIVDDLPSQLTFLALFAVGQSYFIGKDYSHARAAIEAAITSLRGKTRPVGLAEAYFRLGWLYQTPQLNNLSKAVTNIDQAIILKPDYTKAYINRGNARADQRKLDEAIADYNRAIELARDDEFVYDSNSGKKYIISGMAYTNRGWAYYEQGKLDLAIADYNQAIHLTPNDEWAYLNRGWAYYALGKYDEAIADYDRAIELQPNSALIYLDRAKAYHDQEKLDEAIADYNRAIELAHDEFAYNSGKKYLVSALAYLNRGGIYAYQGNIDKAIADFNQSIHLDPNDAMAYINRGGAYHALGKLDEAIADFNQGIKLSHIDEFIYSRGEKIAVSALAYFNRGWFYYYQGKLDEAIADFDKVIQLDPDFASAYNSLCWTYSLKREPKLALPNCQLAIEIDPDPYYYNSRGLAYALLGDFPAAIADFQKFVDFLETLNNPQLAKYFEKRKQWIIDLKAGKNPFTAEMLEELQHE